MAGNQSPHAAAPLRSWFGDALLIIVIGVLWYGRLIGAFFRDDDFAWLSWARQAVGLPLGETLTQPTGFVPLTAGLFLALYRRFGLDPVPYYVTLISLHVIVCVLFYALLRLLSQNRLAALFGALFFLTTYAHHEATTWVAAVHHPLSASFYLAGLLWLVYWLSERTQNWVKTAGWPFGLLIALQPAAWASLALWAKESAITYPLAFLAVEVYLLPRFRDRWGWRIVRYAQLGLGLLSYLMVRATMAMGPEYVSAASYGGIGRIVKNLFLCPPHLIFPDPNFVTHREFLARVLGSGSLPWVHAASTAFAVLFVLAALIGLWRGSRAVRLWIVWIYLTFLPFAPLDYSYALAPRYLYLPAMGMAALFGLLISTLLTRGGTVGAQGLAPLLVEGHPHGLQATRATRRRTGARTVLAVAAVTFVFALNLAFAQLIQSHRLRDSAVRRAMISSAQEELAGVPAGSRVWLVGVPEHLGDIAQALWLWVATPHEYHVGQQSLAERTPEDMVLIWSEGRRDFLRDGPGEGTSRSLREQASCSPTRNLL